MVMSQRESRSPLTVVPVSFVRTVVMVISRGVLARRPNVSVFVVEKGVIRIGRLGIEALSFTVGTFDTRSIEDDHRVMDILFGSDGA